MIDTSEYHTVLPKRAQDVLKKAHRDAQRFPAETLEHDRIIERAIRKVRYEFAELFRPLSHSMGKR